MPISTQAPSMKADTTAVQDRGRGADRAVDGHEIAGGHQQHVTGRDHVEGHRLDGPAGVTPRVPWRALQQGVQVAVGASGGPWLQRPPACQHDADHRGGEQFAHRDRAGDRERRDDIHPDAAAAQYVRDRPQRVRRSACPGRQSGGIPSLRGSRKVQQAARGQAGRSNGEQHGGHVPGEPPLPADGWMPRR